MLGLTARSVRQYSAKASYHWNFERALSVATVPLLVSAAYGLPLVDFGLGIVIPLHCHLGFDTIITDYVQPHKHPTLNKVLSYSLIATTGLVMFGCFKYNTNDVGLTQGVKRIWTGKD